MPFNWKERKKVEKESAELTMTPLAKILRRATALFGSRVEAEEWMERPAMALDQRRPIDLLSTPAGVEAIEDHLTRLEYGVYT